MKLIKCKHFRPLIFALALPAVALQSAEPMSTSTVQLKWTTEVMSAPSLDKLTSVQFGAHDAVAAKNGAPSNRRLTNVDIIVHGVPVPVYGWMYLDLANPSDAPYVVYGNEDGITIRFRVGQDGNAWDVAYRLAPRSGGYRVVERQVCNAEMKPDACVVTYRSFWPPD